MMKRLSTFVPAALLALFIRVCAPADSGAQGPSNLPGVERDSRLIGAVVGMARARPADCGRNDFECATIVRVALGLPAVARGAGVGALTDVAIKPRGVRPAIRLTIEPSLGSAPGFRRSARFLADLVVA